MKNVNLNISHLLASLLLTASFSACSWLDVGSNSEIDGDEMFLNTEGYYTAITGIYVNMGNSDIYGGLLPLLALEPPTQQYTQPENDPDRPKWGQSN